MNKEIQSKTKKTNVQFVNIIFTKMKTQKKKMKKMKKLKKMKKTILKNI